MAKLKNVPEKENSRAKVGSSSVEVLEICASPFCAKYMTRTYVRNI